MQTILVEIFQRLFLLLSMHTYLRLYDGSLALLPWAGKECLDKFIARECAIIAPGNALLVIHLHGIGGLTGLVDDKRYGGIGVRFQPTGGRVVGQEGYGKRLAQ